MTTDQLLALKRLENKIAVMKVAAKQKDQVMDRDRIEEIEAKLEKAVKER